MNTGVKHLYKNRQKEIDKYLKRPLNEKYKQFLFRDFIIYLQMIILVSLGYFFYQEKNKKEIYVIIDGKTSVAKRQQNVIDDSQIDYFLETYLDYWFSFSDRNYERQRERIKNLSSSTLLSQLQLRDARSKLVKSILKSDLFRSNFKSYRIKDLKRNGNIITVDLTATREVVTPTKTYTQEKNRLVKMMVIERSKKNRFGLIMFQFDDKG